MIDAKFVYYFHLLGLKLVKQFPRFLLGAIIIIIKIKDKCNAKIPVVKVLFGKTQPCCDSIVQNAKHGPLDIEFSQNMSCRFTMV
jgi:hypothetical protein